MSKTELLQKCRDFLDDKNYLPSVHSKSSKIALLKEVEAELSKPEPVPVGYIAEHSIDNIKTNQYSSVILTGIAKEKSAGYSLPIYTKDQL